MDSMIQRRNTGSPTEFAKKLEISRSTFFEYIAYMRDELMLNIQYNRYTENYYYDGNNLCSVLGISYQALS
ncbi:MAG: hypothetical protein LUI85_13630 [Bacteroides sp.]|nr:hypothetical protein [Bacteroides sp.]